MAELLFEKILVPLDGSENAERALPWVRMYASGSRTSVVLVQALSKVYPLEGLPFGAGEDKAGSYLEEMRKSLLAEGILAKVQLPQSTAAEAIVKTAVRERCGLIVMTTRGASKVVRWLIGGVTEQVLRMSPVPVLVVRSQYRSGSSPRRILAPQDGSIHAKRALPWAERLARFHRVPLEILHVETSRRRPFRKLPAPRGQASPVFAHWCSLLRRRGVAATYALSRGDAASEILRNSLPTDLIVMTTHGYGGVKHLLLGSVAEKVIHGSEAPIFVFKHRSTITAKKTTLVGDGDASAGGKKRRRAESKE